jgi:hypothetical protein
MKKLITILIALFLFSCGNREYRVAKITHGNKYKRVEARFGNSELRDTSFYVSATVPDSAILKHLHNIEDSLKKEKKDSLRAIFVVDSLYREFQQDSINFRKITKKINGGYNSWEYRYKLWLNARKVLKLNIEEDKK